MAGGRLLFSDMGSHGMEDGDALKHALFPKLYPRSDPEERASAQRGECTRTWEAPTWMGPYHGAPWDPMRPHLRAGGPDFDGTPPDGTPWDPMRPHLRAGGPPSDGTPPNGTHSTDGAARPSTDRSVMRRTRRSGSHRRRVRPAGARRASRTRRWRR